MVVKIQKRVQWEAIQKEAEGEANGYKKAQGQCNKVERDSYKTNKGEAMMLRFDQEEKEAQTRKKKSVSTFGVSRHSGDCRAVTRTIAS